MIWLLVSGFSKHLEIRTFSIIFAKPGLMADTLLILALPSSRSRWLFPLSMPWFSPNCWLHSWAAQDLVRPVAPRLLMNAPKASWMTCTIHGMSLLNAGHWIPEAWRVNCNSWVIEKFEDAWSVVIPSQHVSASSKCATFFKCRGSCAPVCWLLTYHP